MAMAPAVRCCPLWHLGSGGAASEPDLTWRTAGAEGRSRSARYSKSCRARAPSRVSQGTLDTHSSPGSCHTQTHTPDTRRQGDTATRLCAAQKKGMETHGALIAVIGDEETVTGMLLAGVGNVDARRTSNFMVVDSSALPPLTAAAPPRSHLELCVSSRVYVCTALQGGVCMDTPPSSCT